MKTQLILKVFADSVLVEELIATEQNSATAWAKAFDYLDKHVVGTSYRVEIDNFNF